MDETAQEKLDRLDAANRARVKKFKTKAIAKGFKQITALVDGMTYDELCKRRDKALQAGEQISIAEVIKRSLFGGPIAPGAPEPPPAPKAIDRDQDQDPRQLLLFVDPIEAPAIEDEKFFTLTCEPVDYGNQPGLTPETAPEPMLNQGDELPDYHGKTLSLDKKDNILIKVVELYPGRENAQKRADVLNQAGVPCGRDNAPWDSKKVMDTYRNAVKRQG